ncbi:MAG: flagellar basal body rod protein FlgC [Thermodesulfobacteriota bacterium]
MDLFTAMQASGSALKAERTRMNIASMNLANTNTTRTIEGGPYRAKSVIFAARRLGDDFAARLTAAEEGMRGVEVVKVVEDQTPFKQVYDPGHPDADENGMVLLPNVNPAEQMVDIMEAKRDYGANVTALEAAKTMALRALDIGR